MKTTCNRIDWSVNSLTEKLGETSMRFWNKYKPIPMFPISTAEALKSNLVKRFIVQYAGVAARLVYQAVNEAYALAVLTGEPLLVLPVLAEEKVQAAACWTARQNSLLHGAPLAIAA